MPGRNEPSGRAVFLKKSFTPARTSLAVGCAARLAEGSRARRRTDRRMELCLRTGMLGEASGDRKHSRGPHSEEIMSNLRGTLTGHNAWVGGIAFSADSKYLATASADRTVRLWDAHRLTAVETFRGHDDAVCAV